MGPVWGGVRAGWTSAFPRNEWGSFDLTRTTPPLSVAGSDNSIETHIHTCMHAHTYLFTYVLTYMHL